MQIHDCRPLDEIFSHEDLDGVTRHFNTSAMVRGVMHSKVTPLYRSIDLSESLVAYIEKNHGVEQSHLSNVEHTIDNPVVLVEFEDGTSLVVDGNHRIVKRWRKGLKSATAMVFKPDQWAEFLVTGFEVPRSLYLTKELLL